MELLTAIREHIPLIEARYGKQVLREFAQRSYSDISHYHFSIGLFIRNEILVSEGMLFHLFLQYGITHKDDMSDFMLRILYVYERM